MAKQIWIDGYEANVHQRLGSSQVAFELLRNIEKLDHRNEYTILLPSLPLADLPKEREGWRYKIVKPNNLWTFIALPISLFTSFSKPDLVFSPTHYIPRFSPSKRIVTVFDLSFLRFPEMFKKDDLWKLTNWTKYSVENAEHIITISYSSKQDLISLYHVDEKKVTVAYPGYNSSVFYPEKSSVKISEVKKKYSIDGNYFIYVGTIQPRKNLIRLTEAFKDIKDYKLVVVGKTKGLGKEGWMFEETLNKPKELGIEERIIFTGFVPNEELNYLINGATAFVLPSLYEGFGIPVVDAMACGKPVLVSNISSLPEVVGDAGLFFDPKSADDIKDKLNQLIKNPKLQKELSEKSIKQAKKFSWEKMAQEVIQVFEKI